MASISRERGGRRTIQFVAADGKRKSIRLGKASQRIAEEVRTKVEILNSATIAGSPIDNETARWVRGLSETLADKLAAVELIPKRYTARLGEFIDQYIAARTDVKPNSRKNFEATKARLLEFFASATKLRDISAGDADAWLVSLRTA